MFLLLFLLLIPCEAAKYSEYDDGFARKLLVLAASAYSPTPENCLQNRFANTELIQKFDVKCDLTENNTCSGYIALIHEERAIALVFRGTTSKDQLQLEGVSGFFERGYFEELGRVNRYFHNGFEAIWNSGMEAKFNEISRNYPGYDLWITGHSLGGALASLASAHLVSTRGYNAENSAHYSFGQPRVGDEKYAEEHSKLIPWYYRVTHARDVVVDLFPLSLGYRHHVNEVWYDNAMLPGASYRVCRKNFDWKCIKLPIPLPNMLDHRYYFNVKITKYGKGGCEKPIAM
ncbi:unnamed protein product [Bursaphelenchus xylophilus]|uniref:(pine wood nematode) hypothetical protein n=1 Tax=Bursaphelenchus xylophilus TaxID=6326 RepID=A0A1I7S8J0_BURXY|nr:unnamed protein product [Bursaphelenchus xylophilus]CAG9121123.1 unnamed protein product [Bursaphelenchus xylophilus]